MKFSEQLAALPASDHLQRIELHLPDGTLAGVIENQPGSQGSVKVYQYLFQQFACINAEAARAGLKIYAEHTEDAELHPGKHPNIDRLFDVISTGVVLKVTLI
jgi:hypothetical protein